MRAALLLLALSPFASAGAAEGGWTLKQTDVRETCFIAAEKAEVCLFKQNEQIWISVLDKSGFNFSDVSMLVQIDGVPHPVYQHSSNTRPALVSVTFNDTTQQPNMSSFRLRPNNMAFQEALAAGRLMTISTAPGPGPIWQVQVSLEHLRPTLDQL